MTGNVLTLQSHVRAQEAELEKGREKQLELKKQLEHASDMFRELQQQLTVFIFCWLDRRRTLHKIERSATVRNSQGA